MGSWNRGSDRFSCGQFSSEAHGCVETLWLLAFPLTQNLSLMERAWVRGRITGYVRDSVIVLCHCEERGTSEVAFMDNRDPLPLLITIG